MFLLVWTICMVFVILVVKNVLRLKRMGSYVKRLPGIPFKAVLPLLQPNTTTTELFKIYENITNYLDGDGLKKIWLLHKLVVLCDDPVNLRTILMSKDCLSKPYQYRLVSAVGEGILFSKGKTFNLLTTLKNFGEIYLVFLTVHHWRKDRKNVNMVFALSILKTFASKFNRRFCNLTKSLERFVDQPEFDLSEHILGSNLETFMGEFDLLAGSKCYTKSTSFSFRCEFPI